MYISFIQYTLYIYIYIYTVHHHLLPGQDRRSFPLCQGIPANAAQSHSPRRQSCSGCRSSPHITREPQGFRDFGYLGGKEEKEEDDDDDDDDGEGEEDENDDAAEGGGGGGGAGIGGHDDHDG